MECRQCPQIIENVEHKPYDRDGVVGVVCSLRPKSRFKGRKFSSLSVYECRKMENVVTLAHLPSRTYFIRPSY